MASTFRGANGPGRVAKQLRQKFSASVEDLESRTKDELEAIASDLKVMPSSGSGAKGAVLKNDLIDALVATNHQHQH